MIAEWQPGNERVTEHERSAEPRDGRNASRGGQQLESVACSERGQAGFRGPGGSRVAAGRRR